MNYFFSINSNDFKTTLTIPKFQNRIDKNLKCQLFSASVLKNQWIISQEDLDEDKNFFYINKGNDNHKIYFLSNHQEIIELKNSKKNKLLKLNSITDTDPAFRANLQIENINGASSSYQLEYPYSMTIKNGRILSSISMLLSNKAELNRIYFRNIFFKPVIEKFQIYIINIKEKKLLATFDCKTNYTNEINVSEKFINENNFIFSEKHLGIPIFFSSKNNHLSLEHTHPPHLYIMGSEKFDITKNLKDNIINEIFEKNI